MRSLVVFALVGSATLAACGPSNKGFRPPKTSATHADAKESAGDLTSAKVSGVPDSPNPGTAQTGNATWYGAAFAGKKTANGERFDPSKYTAAHRKLPFGTWVEVRRLDTGGTVRVRITDRGPFGHEDRIIDLSKKAAEDLDMIRDGVARVEIRVVDGP